MGNGEGYPECSEEELFLLQLAWRGLVCLAQQELPLLLQPALWLQPLSLLHPPLLLPLLLLLKDAKTNRAPGRNMGLEGRTEGEEGPEQALKI